MSSSTTEAADSPGVVEKPSSITESHDQNIHEHARSSSTTEVANSPGVQDVESPGIPGVNEPSATHELQNQNLHQNERDRLTNTTEPPPLHTPHKRRIMLMTIGIGIATLDLSFLPITYFYALKFGTSLKLQLIFAVITAVYGMISFGHFGLRSFKLFLSRYGSRYKPLGWTRWGMLEFFHINTLITIALVETELVIATAPDDPILRLCAMPSPTICFYYGGVLILSAIFTQLKWKLPFNMSSTPKGHAWRPAMYAFIEDCGAIEARGESNYREKLNARYEASPLFREMIMQLSYFWGSGLLCIAAVSTVLVFTITGDVAFGLGWGLPYAFMIVWALITILFVQRSLKREKAVWRAAALEISPGMAKREEAGSQAGTPSSMNKEEAATHAGTPS